MHVDAPGLVAGFCEAVAGTMARIGSAARISRTKPEQQAVSGTAIAAGDATGSQTLPARKPYRINPLPCRICSGTSRKKGIRREGGVAVASG